MTTEEVLAWTAVVFAAAPAAMYYRHGRVFVPPRRDHDGTRPRISLLIPARNEAGGIARALDAALSSRGVELEVVVLDDCSTDATADIVSSYANRDARVRLETAPELPDGWCGKQHACSTLSRLANYDTFAFLDADVRLAPDALARLEQFRRDAGADLVSGFPRQETVTILEKLLLPLINWLIVCYLPVRTMRRSRIAGFGAGCGQWFLTTRAAYERSGGHSAIRASLHDGVKLPRAYRAAGLRTDICDATELATCRMYHSAGQVWYGLAKNAREGLGGPVSIYVWTILLVGGHVLPFILLACAGADRLGAVTPPNAAPPAVLWLSLAACVLSLLPRLLAAARFRQSWLGASLHPVGISLLLTVQWYAAVRSRLGRPVGWKGRAHPSVAPPPPGGGSGLVPPQSGRRPPPERTRYV